MWAATEITSFNQIKQTPFFCFLQEICSDDNLFFNHLSSFLLKPPLILSFLVSSHKNIHTVTAAIPQKAKSTRHTHTHTSTHTHNFYWLTFLPYTVQKTIHSLTLEEKPFTDQLCSSLCRLSVVSGREC